MHDDSPILFCNPPMLLARWHAAAALLLSLYHSLIITHKYYMYIYESRYSPPGPAAAAAGYAAIDANYTRGRRGAHLLAWHGTVSPHVVDWRAINIEPRAASKTVAATTVPCLLLHACIPRRTQTIGRLRLRDSSPSDSGSSANGTGRCVG